MKVSINIPTTTIELGSKGIILPVYDNDGKYIGKLRIGKAIVEWCPGKTRIGNGSRYTWENFISLMEEG